MQIQFPGFSRIVADPDFCEGQPRIAGTRITVSALLTYIAGGMTVEQLKGEFPKLSVDDIYEALSFAAIHFRDRYLPLRTSATA